ncbi:MAG: hypothetical protein ACRDRK_22875, partial [Pseudonocardia sp.]
VWATHPARVATATARRWRSAGTAWTRATSRRAMRAGWRWTAGQVARVRSVVRPARRGVPVDLDPPTVEIPVLAVTGAAAHGWAPGDGAPAGRPGLPPLPDPRPDDARPEGARPLDGDGRVGQGWWNP